MELENRSSTQHVEQLLNDKHANSVEIALLTKELKGIKGTETGRHKLHTNIVDQYKSDLDKQAITIVNAAGKVTSPFGTKGS